MKNKHVISRILPVLILSVSLLLNGCQSGSSSVAGDVSDAQRETKQIDTESQFDGMYIFGEAEKVTVVSEGFTYNARLDTGATTTSIHALDISEFTRDGAKWVRFSLVNPKTDEKVQLERALSRVASIKRHGAEEQKRPVVKLEFKMGPVEKVCEVSLTDRSNFEYPVLVGRNLLSGVAVVDVSRIYTDGIKMEGE